MSLRLPGGVMSGDRLDRVVAEARVMMVDDESLNMDVLQVHLEAEGYRHFTALADSTQALDRLVTAPPDVLLLDLMMPDVSGFDILEAMREDSVLAQVPVIVLTSSDDAATKLRALELGATDFLSKPVDASELALRMRNTLAARSWQVRRSRLDTLTELPNRSCLMGLMERELVRLSDSADEHAVLAIVNVNRFKAINDSLGTERGDEVLWFLRERLLSVFGRNAHDILESMVLGEGASSCVARIGGDRFAVYLTQADDGLTTFAQQRIERFLEGLTEPLLIDDEPIYLSVSVGVASLVVDGANVPDVLNVAETAMEHARSRGDNRLAFYAATMDEHARERLSMENGLRTAVDDGGIFLTYQPKLDVTSGAIVGAEALVRWQHPAHGLISPVDFIPLAEDSGMIVSIGEWVLREACTMARRWQRAGASDFKIAVNVSMRQLHEPDFTGCVARVLEATELDATSLVVELTENMIMENAEANVAKLERLRALGIALSIDDFGTGYSSLAYLQRFPIDQLKIDRSFIEAIDSWKAPAPIVKAIVSLAHDLGLEVVAEGIENVHQLARMKALKCEQYQGFLASRPVVAEDFEQLLFGDGTALAKSA